MVFLSPLTIGGNYNNSPHWWGIFVNYWHSWKVLWSCGDPPQRAVHEHQWIKNSSVVFSDVNKMIRKFCKVYIGLVNNGTMDAQTSSRRTITHLIQTFSIGQLSICIFSPMKTKQDLWISFYRFFCLFLFFFCFSYSSMISFF